VFEGPDGVGKSSAVRDVAERLRSLAIRHSVLAFPGHEPGTLGKVVYDIHHDSGRFGIEAMSEAAKQTLHIAAHLDAIERRIGPLLNGGEHVLLDRFWWSTWVYGVVGGVPPRTLDALIEAERIQWGSVQPSLVVLLDRDEPIQRDQDRNDWRRIRAAYLALASKERTHYPVEVVQSTGRAETAKRIVDLALSCGL
jgi:thymidylate kinase